MDGDILHAAHQLVGKGPAEHFRKETAARASDHDLRDVLELGEAQNFGRQVVADQHFGFGAEALRELESLIQSSPLRLIDVTAGPLDRHHDPRRIHQVGEALRRAHDHG